MKRFVIVGGVLAVVLAVALALAVGRGAAERRVDPQPATTTTTTTDVAGEAHPAFLYGRVTTIGGATYEGRLRWGGAQEAVWTDFFNGYPRENRWAAHVPPDELPRERGGFSIFGLELGGEDRPVDLVRPFMARFGDVARIAVDGVDVRVTLKSGTEVELDRMNASDVDDGLRVWDARHGVVDLDSLQLRTVELLPAPASGAGLDRLYGTVRTRHGDAFTGFVVWDGDESVATDELAGSAADGERVALPYGGIRAIARRSADSARVTLADGRELVLSDTDEVGDAYRGVAVDDPRYGRVQVTWDAFERVDFGAAGRGPAESAGPAYDDFPPGHPLTGAVTTRDGRRLAGRLVYDLDESETTATLDAPARGVHYTVPFGLVAAIVPPDRAARATVTLHDGEALPLEPTGDLGEQNAGLLVFADGRDRPVYVPWSDVARVDLDRPPARVSRGDGRGAG